MNHEQRNGMRHRRGSYPLAAGIIASALLHLLLVLLNPAMVAPWYGRPGGTPSAPGAQFTVLSLSPDDEDDLIPMEATPPTIPPTAAFGTPGAAPDDAGGPGRAVRPEPGVDATVAERLRYNTRPFSKPVPMPETEHRRATRETAERVLRAAEELGPLAPVGVERSRGGGGGISIPFGFGPPPPAQTVPAPPLPDSILRQDSIRAAARAAERRDSLRAARDTTRLRNVAPRKPLLLRRVLPDTTGRSH